MVTTCTNTSSSQSDKAVKSRHRSTDVDETSVLSQEQPQKFEHELDFEEPSSIIEENSTAV